MKAYILSGISGAGKSTYAKRMWPTATICSADDYFMRDGSWRFEPSLLGQAHATCFRSFVDALRAGDRVVVCDNTNTKVEEISPYVLAAYAFGYDPTIFTFYCDRIVASDRNVHYVPTNVIDRQRRSLYDRVLPAHWRHETIDAISNGCGAP